jgi:hypothetical protein
MTTRHKWADVIIAYAEGKEIQCRVLETDPWHRAETIQGIDNNLIQFRIKPEVKTGWINIYPETINPIFYSSKKDADYHAVNHRIACIQISYTEGEGLE